MATQDKKATFVSIPLKGDDDDTILNNYKAIAPDLQKLDGGKVQLAGLEPVANALTGTIATDQQRMEILALPLVAIVLFFVFGGVIAAALPAIVGGLCIAGALGILRLIAVFGPVHYFAQPVVSLVGLGIAIDYGLFIVSRFREEIAEGYDTETAVRRTVITAGRTVIFSAVLIVASAIGLLLFPQGFLKSLTYAMIASVMLSAILSITLLPACLGVLGKHVDALGVRTLFRVPFLRNWKVSAAFLNWLADRLQRTKTREEMENGFWGKLVNLVMKRPVLFAVPIVFDHARADHSGGQTVARRDEREVPAAGQSGAPGAGAVRQALPGLSHQSADPGHSDHQPSAGLRPADRGRAQQGDGDQRVHRAGQRPGEHVARAPGRVRAPRRIRPCGFCRTG